MKRLKNTVFIQKYPSGPAPPFNKFLIGYFSSGKTLQVNCSTPEIDPGDAKDYSL